MLAALRREIETGQLRPGELLPSFRELARAHKVSLSPVVQAIGLLEREGLMTRLPNEGVRVALAALPSARRGVHVIGFLHRTPGARHSRGATHEALLGALLHRPDLDLRISTLPSDDYDAPFARVLREAREEPPRVIAFAFPEILTPEARSLIRELRARGNAVVYRSTVVDIEECDRVRSDFRSGQESLTRFLRERGHRSILRLSSVLSDAVFEREKELGFRAAMDGAEGRTEIVRDPGMKPQDRVNLVAGLMVRARAEMPFTAVMGYNDFSATVAAEAQRLLGWKDLEITGYDNLWDECFEQIRRDYGEAAAARPPLATVDCMLPAVGAAIAEIALARVDGTLPPGPALRSVPQTLVVGPGAGSG